MDEPDLSLKSAGLLERPEAAITLQTTGDNIYSSAQKFEDLPLSPELLKVCSMLILVLVLILVLTPMPSVLVSVCDICFCVIACISSAECMALSTVMPP